MGLKIGKKTATSYPESKPNPFADRRTGIQRPVAAPTHDDVKIGLLTDPNEINRERERIAAQQGSSELWRVSFGPRQGETKLMFYRGKLGVIIGHNVSIRNARGKIVGELNVCSMPDSVRGSCGFCDEGIPQVTRHVHEVVDVTGYQPKNGPRVTNIPMFYIVSDPREAQFQAALNLMGSRVKSELISVASHGTGPSTTHVYSLAGKKASAQTVGAPSIRSQIHVYMAALPQEDQRRKALASIALKQKEQEEAGYGEVSDE